MLSPKLSEVIYIPFFLLRQWSISECSTRNNLNSTPTSILENTANTHLRRVSEWVQQLQHDAAILPSPHLGRDQIQPATVVNRQVDLVEAADSRNPAGLQHMNTIRLPRGCVDTCPCYSLSIVVCHDMGIKPLPTFTLRKFNRIHTAFSSQEILDLTNSFQVGYSPKLVTV